MENLTLKGKWWLPQYPERRISGELNYSRNGGVELSLDGLIAPPNETFSSENIELIYGEAYGNKTVTLIDCSAMLVQFASGGLSTSNYFANQMFIGGFHLKNTEPNFKASSTSFYNLTNWIRAEWFYHDKIKDEIKIRDGIQIELMKTDEIELKLVEVHSKTFSFSDIHIFNNTIISVR